jgi:addiction module RelE/StbE family toxin
MAYRIAWSRTSLKDLKSIIRYIARDSSSRAESFGYRIITKVELLSEHPDIGRSVPEFHSDSIREIILSPYRIIYRVSHSIAHIEIARIWHASRGEPNLP